MSKDKDFITNDIMRAFEWKWDTSISAWVKGESIVNQDEAYEIVDYKIMNSQVPARSMWFRLKRFITRKYYLKIVSNDDPA